VFNLYQGSNAEGAVAAEFAYSKGWRHAYMLTDTINSTFHNLFRQADAGIAFEKQRPPELQRQINRRRQPSAREVALPAKRFLQCIDRAEAHERIRPLNCENYRPGKSAFRDTLNCLCISAMKATNSGCRRIRSRLGSRANSG